MRTIKPLTAAELTSIRSEKHIPDHSGQIPYYLPERIMTRLHVEGECWLVVGWNSGNGYANISILGNTRKVHRVIYELLVGPIPTDHVLDHKKDEGCTNRACCNIGHLEPVTVDINTYRGAAKLFTTEEKYA